MRRRRFIGLIAGAASWPMTAHGQQDLPVVGYLITLSEQQAVHMLAAFRVGLDQGGCRRSKRKPGPSMG